MSRRASGKDHVSAGFRWPPSGVIAALAKSCSIESLLIGNNFQLFALESGPGSDK
jgi:hypothetical protein